MRKVGVNIAQVVRQEMNQEDKKKMCKQKKERKKKARKYILDIFFDNKRNRKNKTYRQQH